MRLRNGVHGYGAVTKTLHWLTVAAIVAQFAVGLTMTEREAGFDRADDEIDRLEKLGKDEARKRGDAAEEKFEAQIEYLEEELKAREDNYVADAFGAVFTGRVGGDGLSLPDAHVLLGVGIILLAALRMGWRAATPLPPWADHLGPSERRTEAIVERVLIASLFVVPCTGLLLVATDTDLLVVHLAAQLALLAAVALHVGIVLRHTVFHHNRHLARMI